MLYSHLVAFIILISYTAVSCHPITGSVQLAPRGLGTPNFGSIMTSIKNKMGGDKTTPSTLLASKEEVNKHLLNFLESSKYKSVGDSINVRVRQRRILDHLQRYVTFPPKDSALTGQDSHPRLKLLHYPPNVLSFCALMNYFQQNEQGIATIPTEKRKNAILVTGQAMQQLKMEVGLCLGDIRTLQQRASQHLLGCDLNEYMKAHQNQIPDLVKDTVDSIEAAKSLSGVFRKSSVNSKVELIFDMYDKKDPKAAVQVKANPILAANVLKRFFRDLYQPILPADVIQQVLAKSSTSTLLEYIKTTPANTRRVLRLVFKALGKFDKLQETDADTTMTVDDVAKLLAPNFIDSLAVTQPQLHQLTAEDGVVTKFIVHLIRNPIF